MLTASVADKLGSPCKELETYLVTPMPKVFVSHSTEDRAFVEGEIKPLLKQHGIETWYCKDDIRTAGSFEDNIREGLESCEWFLVVLSPRSVSSEWVRDEVFLAIKRNKHIVPVLIADCDIEKLSLRLPRIQHVEFRTATTDSRKSLLAEFGIEYQEPIEQKIPFSDSDTFDILMETSLQSRPPSLSVVTELPFGQNNPPMFPERLNKWLALWGEANHGLSPKISAGLAFNTGRLFFPLYELTKVAWKAFSESAQNKKRRTLLEGYRLEIDSLDAKALLRLTRV